MRPKRIPIVLACLTVIVFTCAYFVITKPKPSISMGIVKYVDETDEWFPAAVVGLTNTGSVVVRWDDVGLAQKPRLRFETRTGWVSQPFHFVGGVIAPPEVLKPNSNIVFLVPLPDETLRWQLGYTIRGASTRDRFADGFMSEGDLLAFRLTGYLQLTNEGAPQEFWTEVFDMPGTRELNKPTNAATLGRVPVQ